MRKMFHKFSINNTKRKIKITKLNYNNILYDKDIKKIFEIFNKKYICLESFNYLNNIIKTFDVKLLYDNYIIIKDAIILNNNINKEFFCIKLLFELNDIEIYVVSGNIDFIDSSNKFQEIIELSLT